MDRMWRSSHGLWTQPPDALSSDPKTNVFVEGLMKSGISEDIEGTHPVLMYVDAKPRPCLVKI